jgi:predicted CopG family antitoxin
MPRKGYKTVTIKETLYEKIEDKAKKEEKSVSQIVADCLTQHLEVPA